ncbi:MAG TPA: arginine--tRNA ligase [Polyangiales bacterium]|nr:arginine--tRNA ligase [Polyangiales bacterium]
MRLEPTLEVLGTTAIRDVLGVEAPAVIRAANPSHGDYQLNGVLPLAKQLNKVPRELAQAVADRLQTESAIASAEVAGPGFINIKLDPTWVAAQVLEVAKDTARDGVPRTDRPLRTVVDFSGPNIAKQMHVGHLRSTIIGDAICRLLRFIGHPVIGDNHLGDWGTQFGLLIVGMREFGSKAALEKEPIEELERIYKLATAKAKEDPATAAAARAELAKLQRGDPENRALWEQFVAATRVELDATYARLGVTFDQWLGESAYEELLAGVVEDLKKRNIAREDQGALCVFFEDQPELGKSPLIIQKQDGAYLYSTTDIATVLYRRDHFQCQRAVYVVDKRQALHFKQLFATVRKLGIEMELEHVSFGSVMGKDGKPLKTRDGGTIKLAELLDEAQARASERMRSAREENVLELSDAQIDELAPVVGIGAVRYADLMQNRSSDYQFDWDKLISFKGNAGPYLQYAHARIAALFRKGEVDPATLPLDAPLALAHPVELALAKHLLRFADAVNQAAEQSLPHLVCEHLYDLARHFSAFYEACPVLKAEPRERTARLVLAWLVGRQLRRGLGLLGIEAPERM